MEVTARLHESVALTASNGPQNMLRPEARGPHCRSGCFKQEKHFFSIPAIKLQYTQTATENVSFNSL